MGEFFKGWQRWACSALVMACIVLGLWISGGSVVTEIIFGRNEMNVKRKFKHYYAIGNDGRFARGFMANSFHQITSYDGMGEFFKSQTDRV